jgi:hypothetical protein
MCLSAFSDFLGLIFPKLQGLNSAAPFVASVRPKHEPRGA